MARVNLMGRATSEAVAVARGSTPTHRHLRDRVTVVIVVTVFVDAVCTVLAYLVERHAPQTDIHSVGSAAFWTTSQLLTVSSSMSNPLSSAGRALDVLMEIYAITVVASLAGSFGAFFHRRSQERSPQ